MNIPDAAGMSFDQIMQILGVAGAWFSGIGALAAVIVALWFARRAEKINLKIHVGLRTLYGVGVPQELLIFDITNRGERAVTINNVGWSIGYGKNKKYSIQNLSPSYGDQIPKKIQHGENASFMVFSFENPKWEEDFVEKFIGNTSMETLRAQIYTSIGHIENVRPEKNFVERLENIRKSRN